MREQLTTATIIIKIPHLAKNMAVPINELVGLIGDQLDIRIDQRGVGATDSRGVQNLRSRGQ